MSLAIRCRNGFTNEVRLRGQRYAEQSRVGLVDVWETGVAAWARGSGGKEYEVEVDWEFAADGSLEVDCDCPYYSEHRINCKHIWALFLLLDQEGISDLVPGKGKLTLGTLEGDFFSGEGEKRASPEPMTTWRNQFKAVRQWAPHEAATPGIGPVGKRSQLWAVLRREKVSPTEALEVCFYCRDWLKSGKLGKLKSATLGLEDFDRFAPEDRGVLRYLLGVGLSGASGLYDPFRSQYDLGGYQRRYRSVSISPMLLDEAFPRLCASGRFGWLSADKRRVEPLALLPGTWRWGLRLEDHGEGLRLDGVLEPASEDAEAPPPDLGNSVVLESGWLFFDHALARLEEGPRIFPWAQMLSTQGPVEIPREDEAQAVQALLESKNLPPLDLPGRMAPRGESLEPVPRLRFESRHGLFIGKIAFLYGAAVVPAHERASYWFDEATVRVGFRRPESERRALESLAGAEPRIPVRGTEVLLVEGHFADAVRHLHEAGWRVEVDHRPVRISDGFSGKVSSGIDWFELSGRMQFGASQAGLPVLLAALRKKKRYVVLDDGSMGLLPEEWLQRFGSLSGMAMAGEVAGESLRFERQQGLLLDALLADEESVESDATFEELRQRLRSAGDLEPVAAPRTLQGTLRPYQEEGLGWIGWLSELGLGGCLADDMGLGKTIQVLAFLEECRLADEAADGWSLLVVPRSLLGNWVAEGQRFTPNLPLHVYHGPGRQEALDALREARRPVVLVTTYGTLRRDITTLREVELATVVLDEAQAIKNADSQTAKACRLVRARRRLALTGTPVENHLGELWSLFEFLNPGMLGQLPSLSRVAGERTLSPEALELVAKALRPLILRRTKQQVLKDLPQKTEQILYCELSTQERGRYDELRNHYRAQLGSKVASVGLGRSKMQVLEALLRLRQVACHGALLDPSLEKASSAKLEVLLDRLDEVVEAGGKALVFSQFTRLLALVRRQLDRKKLTYEYLDGRTRKREEKVERFQTDPDCLLFLISLKAGGVGLNLTAASYVFLLDPWWNPAVESQAIDRAHRIGQERPVFAYRLIARDTVEEKILQMQAAKRSLADAILAQDRRLLGQMTAEDLELLLGGPLEAG